jgi:ribosomal protein S14
MVDGHIELRCPAFDLQEGQEMKSIWTHRRLRLVVAGVATLLTGAALASAAVAGMRALDLGPAAASQYPGKKVTVCHRTHSKKHPWVKIRISRHALRAHLRHGDFVVDVTHPCPPATTASAKKNKHQGKGKHQDKGKHHQDAAKAKHEAGNKGHGKK